jgi:hypothetical protein
MTIWNILWPFGIIHGHLVYFVVFCYIFPDLVCLDEEKSGNHVEHLFAMSMAGKQLTVGLTGKSTLSANHFKM